MILPAGPDALRASGWKAGVATYGSIALAVWLGWEIVKAPIAQRAPPEIAVRIAPNSPEVLARAAEGELASRRMDNAAYVARESLSRAPFNPQALRVLGLALADSDPAGANPIMTLAGNLSLRDNATHAWLVEQRLRRGDYGSAFAHADTLVRRRIELGPQIFNLYATAAQSDLRALTALVELMATRPRWRQNFLDYLYAENERAPLLATLVLALEPSAGRFSDDELRQLYSIWRSQRRIPGIRLIREKLNRPPLRPYVQNGDFELPETRQLLPFGWATGMGTGISASLTDSGEEAHRNALWIEYDGFSSGMLAEQLVLLPPGDISISGEWRADGTGAGELMAWQVVCVGTEQTLLSTSPPLIDKWTRFSFTVRIPAANCGLQALRLVGVPGEFRRASSVWVDNVRVIAPAG